MELGKKALSADLLIDLRKLSAEKFSFVASWGPRASDELLPAGCFFPISISDFLASSGAPMEPGPADSATGSL